MLQGLTGRWVKVSAPELQETQKCPSFSYTEVILLRLHGIGLTFEADTSIGLMVRPEANKMAAVLQQIPDVKKQNTRFKLLPEVDTFMPQKNIRNG